MNDKRGGSRGRLGKHLEDYDVILTTVGEEKKRKKTGEEEIQIATQF